MKKLIISLTVLIAGFLLLIGCQKDTSSTLSQEPSDEQSIQELLLDEENEYLVDWGIDDGDKDNMFNGFNPFSPDLSIPKITTPIDNVVRYGRRIHRRFPRQIIINFISPDSVRIHLERVLVGKFFIFQKLDSSSAPPDSIVIYRKPLRHSVARNVLLVRRASDEASIDHNPRRRFKLAALSLGLGYSRPEHTVKIHRVTVSTSSGDSIEFTNPLQTMLEIPEDLPTFVRGEQVTVRALVSNSSDSLIYDPQTGATETVLLHFGINPRHHARKKFVFIGEDPVTGFNIYEGNWTVHEPAHRPFHAVVDVIDNGTIYDDNEQVFPYNSTTWSTPYRVVLTK